MRMLAVAVLLVSCDTPAPQNSLTRSGSAAAPPRAEAEPAIVPAPRPDAGPPITPATPPASPLTIPPELASAPAWIGRHFSTGMVVPHSTLTTWTLQRVGDQALLTIDTQRANGAHPDELGPWSEKQTTQLLGTAKTERTLTTVVVSDGSDAMTLRCSSSAVVAAEATAVRAPGRHKPGTEECGDRGHWSPARTRSINVLRCREPDAEPEDSRGDSPEMRFASAPGVEFLYVNDDCMMQGGGWRSIPKDGSIAPVR